MSDSGSGKGTTAADRLVGSRMRVQRKAAGLTQAGLGSHLGISSQQVQKYERGLNRVGASRLEQIAKALGVPPSHFFGDGQPTHRCDPILDRFLAIAEAPALIAAFSAIDDVHARRQAVEMVRAIKTLSDAVGPTPAKARSNP